MDGVTVMQMMNEVDETKPEDYSKTGDAYRNKRSVILSEENEGGRAMVMRDDERE